MVSGRDFQELKMAEKGPKVVVVGGCYMDMVIKCGQVPAPGQTVIGSVLSYTATGPGANQAAEAALCGCQVHLVSKVGGDPFGQMAKNSLAEFKINTDFVYMAAARNTGIVFTLVNSEGENAACIFPGANAALNPHDIDNADQAIAEADVCLIHGRLPQDTVVRAISAAKMHGTPVLLDPSRPFEHGPTPRPMTVPVEYFSVDIMIPNFSEAADITQISASTSTRGETAKLIGSDLVARGVGSAVITMGKRGCMVVDRKGADHIPAFEIELVDDTCTGDAFAGAMAACYAVDRNVRQAVKFASAAGTLACTKFGSIEALPTKAEIIELLQKDTF